MDQTLPPELFTPASIITLTGATGAVYVTCGALQRALNFNPRWLALAVSLLLALFGAHTTQPHIAVSYLIGIVNGFLIYCTAVGVNGVFAPATGALIEQKGATLDHGTRETKATKGKRSFRSRWF